MKKTLRFFFHSIIIVFLSNNFSFGQSCSSNSQGIDEFNSICVNSGSTTTLYGYYNHFYACDKYGWCDEYWWANPITVKRPDGSVALVIDPSELSADSYSNFSYVFPSGFFNVVGNWDISYLSEDYCSGSNYTASFIVKVVGVYSNSIGSDEVICNVGGTPQNITNLSLASNSTYTNKWQSKTGAGSWNDVSGATLTSYQPTYINQTTLYRRIITTTELGCVSNPSNEVSKYVYPSLTPASIGNNQDVCYNISPAVIGETSAPTGGSSYPNYSYQWYSSLDNTNWNPITGSTSKTYQPSFTLGYTFFKRKTIDASCGETYTNSVQVHGYNDLAPGTIGSDQLICYGATPSAISVTGVETGGIGSNSYQWYSSPDNSSWSAASGSSTGQNYQPPALTSKTYYRKAIINSCKTLYTNTVTIDVRTNLSAGTIGSDQTICYNDTPAIIATLTNPSGASNSYTYQWYYSLDNSTFNPIPGADQVSYQPPALTQTTYYKKKVIDANCPAIFTGVVTVTVRLTFSIGSIGSSQTICNGITPILLTNATAPSGGQGTYTYIWENSLNNTDWSIITGATGFSYQPPALTVTTYYRRKVTDAVCGNGYNNTVTITVKPVFSVGAIGSTQTICINTTPASLTSTSPSGGMGGYTYFWENSLNGTDFNAISGATSETYQPGVLNLTTYYRRHVNDASCGGGYTNVVQINVRTPVTIGTIGADQTICYNSAPGMLTTTSAPSGGSNSFAYTWESSIDNANWNSISGATGTSYQPGSLTAKTYYRKSVTDLCGSGYTNSVTITIRPDVNVGSIGASQTICYNVAPALLTTDVAPTGGTGSFTWLWESSPNNSVWSPIGGATSESFQPASLTSTTYYRRKVINTCSSGYTNTLIITVRGDLVHGTITNNQTICYNATPSILVTASFPVGGTGSYSYQWQSSLNNSAWNNITGATSETYQPGAMITSLYFRRSETSGSCGTVQSNSVLISVNSPVNFGSIVSDQTICYGSIPSLLTTVTQPSGGNNSFTYTWESSIDNTNWNVISGATGTSYQGAALTAKTYYRKSVSDLCGSGYTNSVTITIRPDLNVGSIGSSQTICYNTPPSLLTTDVAPTGGTGSFTWLWESSPNNSTWTTIPGATGEGYQSGNLTATMYYRRKVINSCSSAYTNTITISVRPDITAGAISSSQTICYNTAPALLVTSALPTGGTGTFTYQWQNSVNNSVWNNITGATSETYQSGAMASSLYYRRSETSGSCGTVQTNSVQIVVNNQLVAGTVKSDQTICYGISPGIFLTNTYPTGGTGSYTYQWQKLVASSWTDIQSATSETYTSGNLTSTSYFRRTETSGTCGSVTSNQITVTVRSQFLPGVIGSSQTVNYGAVPAELVSASSPTGGAGSFTYQWQNSLDNSTWSNITGATSESFQPPALTVKKYYKRLTTDASCGTTETNMLTITVNSLLVPGEIKDNQTICYNTTPNQLTTSIIPSGGNGTYLYQWQKTEDGITWTNITAANSDSYQSGALIKTTYFRKRVTSASLDDYSNIVTVTVHDNFIPGVIGADQTICYNEVPGSITSVSLPSGGNGTYTNQWKYSLNSSSWTVVTGATDSFYEPTALTVKTYFKKIVTDQCGVKETNIITINVNPVFIPGTIGDNQTIVFNNAPLKLDVSTVATGGTGTFTYQWQKSLDNLAWTNITGANDAFYQPPATSQTTYFKRLTTSGSCGTLPTNTITITVTTEVLVGTIGSNQTICYLTAPALLTTLTGPSAGVVVNSQNWQKSEDATTWADISTATTDTYQSGVLTKDMYFRKKMVTAGNGTIFTNIVTITVNPAFAPGTIGSDQAVCKASASAPITTTVLPVGQLVQNLWQGSDNNASWTDITGATNDSYDAGVLPASKFFRKKVTSSCGTGYTSSVKITVNDELQGGIIASDQAIAYNTAPSLLIGTLATGGSGTFTYQWYYSVNNFDWQVVITGGDGKDYQPMALSQKTYFKRKVTGGSCGEKYSNTITITVFDSLLPGVVSEAQSICYNTSPALLSGTSPSGGNGQYSYQWQYSLQGVTWTDTTLQVGISFKPGILKVNTYFRRAVTSGNSTAYSNFVMIKVYDPVSQPVTDLKASYCKGSAVNISIVNPAYLSYKWYDSQHTYVMDGTKYTLNSITSNNTVYVKSLTANSCLSDYLGQKIVVDNVKANFTQDITTVTLGDAVKFTSTSINPSSYFWNFFEGDIINETNPVHYYNTLGVNSKKFDVKLTIVSPSGCVDSLSQIGLITVVNNVTGIESNKAAEFSYYPNPVKEKLFLKSDEIIKTVKILNINGKMIQSLTFDNEIVSVDFSQLKSGIYLLEINGLKNSKKNIKIIKQ
jgi:hypothetical protein